MQQWFCSVRIPCIIEVMHWSVGVFNRPNKNSNSTQIILWFWTHLEQIKSLQPIGQEAEFKFESKFKPLPVIWQSLLNAIPERNWRFWLKNQWLSSWGRAQAQLGQVGLARTNTGSFQVGCSHCCQLPASLRQTCYQSCNTDSVWEWKSICKCRTTTCHFFKKASWNFQWN